MFGGLKSILFGYSETSETTTNQASSSSSTATNNLQSHSSINETSAIIEQTLNSATTKFTEQLLPQSPSIEQLQSSSHHLLPTLVEQHEEDERKRQKQFELDSTVLNGDEEEEDCFEADSWELLDLVEKSEGQSLESKSEIANNNNNNNKTGGILKQQQQLCTKEGKDVVQRLKPKVSFETPDLVNAEQSLKSTKECLTKKVKSVKKKKNKQQVESRGNSMQSSVFNLKPEDRPKTKDDSKIQPKPVEKNQCDPPVLNYKAALSMKLDTIRDGEEERKNNITGDGSGNSRTNNVPALKASGAVKRNRPVSSSSWSSSDEIETIDSFWTEQNSFQAQKSKNSGEGSNVVVPLSEANNNEAEVDNESIISSGFSDCDYGYEGLNDFIMRPKKVNSKRRSVATTSSNSMPKKATCSVTKKSANETTSKLLENQDSKSSSGLKSATTNQKLSKNIKPKKKKIVLSHPASYDFWKRPTNESKANAANKLPMFSSTAKTASPSSLMPPPPPSSSSVVTLNAGSTSGNDSSDVAEMDESWFVTPPPCFTGSNKLNKTKAKEAARENALIEHPSIYIASTSAASVQQASGSTVVKTEPEKSVNLKSATSQTSSDGKSKKKSEEWTLTTKLSTKKSQSQEFKPLEKGAKAWENKFIVTNWNYDDQDDINDDFDNLFEPDENSSVKVKKSKSKKQSVVTKKQSSSQKAPSLETSGGYDSDFSLNSPAVIGITDNSSSVSSSIELLQESGTDQPLDCQAKNSCELEKCTDVKDKKSTINVEKKTLVQVRPIEPERQPGWQLRRKRSKRRPLSTVMANVCSMPMSSSKPQGAKMNSCDSQMSDGSNVSSARSSPSLIDRIGSSIVANLNNLTSGFNNGTLPMQQRATIDSGDKFNMAVAKKPNFEANLVARKRMTKSYLARQNDCARVASSSHRSDRRLKMYTTPNGYSINRKVQTSFH